MIIIIIIISVLLDIKQDHRPTMSISTTTGA